MNAEEVRAVYRWEDVTRLSGLAMALLLGMALSAALIMPMGQAFGANTASSSTGKLSVSLSLNSTALDVNGTEDFNAIAINGTGGNYVYDLRISNQNNPNSIIYTNTIITNSIAAYNWKANITGSFLANVILSNSLSNNEIASNTVSFAVNNALTLNPMAVQPGNVAIGSIQTVTANVLGGTPPYYYDFEVYNSIGSAVANSIPANDISDSFAYTQNSIWGTGIFTTSVTVKDTAGANVIGSATYNALPTSTSTSTTSAATSITSTSTSIIIVQQNLTTSFSENGLPSNALWSVTFNGVSGNALAPNDIAFSTLPGNYIFSVSNVIVGNTVYTPGSQSDYLIAGNATSIIFSMQAAVASTTTSSKTSTSTSTITSVPTSTMGISSAISLGISTNLTYSLIANLTNQIDSMQLSHSNKGLPKKIAEAYNISITHTGISYSENIIVASSSSQNLALNLSTIGFAKIHAMYKNYNSRNNTKISISTGAMPSGINIPILSGDNSMVLTGISFMLNSGMLNSSTDVSIASAVQNVPTPPAPAYYYFLINSSINDSSFRSVNYVFTVNRSWIESNRISPSQVVLYKLVNNVWQPLPTTLVGQTSSNYTYSALSDSFSTYLVSFSVNGAHSNSGTALTVNVALPSGYRLYLCSGGASVAFNTTPAPHLG
jgi:PGF-pre-PGF domain-containing protein